GVLVREDGQQIMWKYIEELHKLQEKEGLRLGNKLKMAHIQWRNQKMKVYECLQTFLSDSPAPALDYASGLSLQLLIDIRSLPGCSEEANELYRLLRQPHLQALLSAHDTVAQKDYEPVLPPMPDELPEEEEATRTVCLVKNKQPLLRIKSRLVSGQRVPGADLTAYRSYCVTALLIRHKLPKEAVVEFQSSLQRHRKPPSPQTSEAGPSSPSFRPTTFPDHVAVLNILLEDFKELQEGLEPAPKLINNVQSKLHRIRQFVGWMSHGNTNLGKLLFLGNMGRLRGWVKSLRTNMMSLTTTLHYLKNVRQFVVFIQETPPPSSCLSKTNLRRVVRELKASIKSWVRPVVLHQMRVKEKKDATMHSMKELQECRRLALVAIPKLLSQLEKHHTYLDQCSLFGYVTAYLASLYGHRLGVFLNLTDEQVSQAVYEPEGNDYLIKSFGTAKLLLSDKEYGWFLAIIRLKRKWAIGVKISKYVFHNTTFSSEKNLTKYVKRVWSDMKLRGEATFSSLRSAVATFARDRHGKHSQERKTLPRLMCHDTAISDGAGQEGSPVIRTGTEGGRGESEVATSSMNKCTPRVTRSRAQKGCRVMLFPLKMSPQKSLRMSPQKLTQIIRVRRNRMAERRRK
ncbi:hypothetical protein KUCAC02_032077, partial [Chaenocephalus aceratus]